MFCGVSIDNVLDYDAFMNENVQILKPPKAEHSTNSNTRRNKSVSSASSCSNCQTLNTATNALNSIHPKARRIWYSTICNEVIECRIEPPALPEIQYLGVLVNIPSTKVAEILLGKRTQDAIYPRTSKHDTATPYLAATKVTDRDSFDDRYASYFAIKSVVPIPPQEQTSAIGMRTKSIDYCYIRADAFYPHYPPPIMAVDDLIKAVDKYWQLAVAAVSRANMLDVIDAVEHGVDEDAMMNTGMDIDVVDARVDVSADVDLKVNENLDDHNVNSCNEVSAYPNHDASADADNYDAYVPISHDHTTQIDTNITQIDSIHGLNIDDATDTGMHIEHIDVTDHSHEHDDVNDSRDDDMTVRVDAKVCSMDQQIENEVADWCSAIIDMEGAGDAVDTQNLDMIPDLQVDQLKIENFEMNSDDDQRILDTSSSEELNDAEKTSDTPINILPEDGQAEGASQIEHPENLSIISIDDDDNNLFNIGHSDNQYENISNIASSVRDLTDEENMLDLSDLDDVINTRTARRSKGSKKQSKSKKNSKNLKKKKDANEAVKQSTPALDLKHIETVLKHFYMCKPWRCFKRDSIEAVKHIPWFLKFIGLVAFDFELESKDYRKCLRTCHPTAPRRDELQNMIQSRIRWSASRVYVKDDDDCDLVSIREKVFDHTMAGCCDDDERLEAANLMHKIFGQFMMVSRFELVYNEMKSIIKEMYDHSESEFIVILEQLHILRGQVKEADQGFEVEVKPTLLKHATSPEMRDIIKKATFKACIQVDECLSNDMARIMITNKAIIENIFTTDFLDLVLRALDRKTLSDIENTFMMRFRNAYDQIEEGECPQKVEKYLECRLNRSANLKFPLSTIQNAQSLADYIHKIYFRAKAESSRVPHVHIQQLKALLDRYETEVSRRVMIYKGKKVARSMISADDVNSIL